MTTFNEIWATVKCDQLSAHEWDIFVQSPGALQDKWMSIFGSLLILRDIPELLCMTPNKSRLCKLIPSTLNRFSDRRMKMFPRPWTKIPCSSLYVPKHQNKVLKVAARQDDIICNETFIMEGLCHALIDNFQAKVYSKCIWYHLRISIYFSYLWRRSAVRRDKGAIMCVIIDNIWHFVFSIICYIRRCAEWKIVCFT